MAKIIINDSQLRTSLATFKKDVLANIMTQVQEEQMSQVSEAFRNQGQPGEPWPKMWADKFRGNVAQHMVDKIATAHTALLKLKAAKNPDHKKIFKGVERLDKAKKQAVPATSYRKGGQRLRDNGALAASFFRGIKTILFGVGISRIYSTLFYAVYQQKGLQTKGPNFIPLTLQARRLHSLGVDPKTEGLEEGVDYIMAWRGVKVPPSPMIDYSNTVNKEHIRRAAIIGAKQKGP